MAVKMRHTSGLRHQMEKIHVVTTPGVGFGPSGEGYIRLTAFGQLEDCEEAVRRLKHWLR